MVTHYHMLYRFREQ